MAFTLQEQAQIRDYLGWNARWTQFDSALERAFAFIANLTSGGDSSAEDLARSQLTTIIAIEAEITAAHSRLKATQVGTIKLNSAEIMQLVDRGESYIGRLARILGVEVKGFALRRDLPKTYSTPWGQGGGGGNAQRQG